MKKNNLHIEIVRTTNTGLSSMSQISCDGIYDVLSKHYFKVGVTVVNTPLDLDILVSKKPDLVFLGMKWVPSNQKQPGASSEKIWVANYLDQHDIAYTGSSSLAHELEINKHQAKQRVLEAGLKTPRFIVVSKGRQLKSAEMFLRYPVFIKPTNGGGGLGVDSNSVAHNLKQLNDKVRSISANIQKDSLVEEYLPGREFSIAVLRSEGSEKLSVLPIELVAPLDSKGFRLLSSSVKSSNSERVNYIRDSELKAKVIDLATEVFYALDARDYGRIDVRLNDEGVPQLLEVNLLPSLINGYGSFPKACVLNMGLDYEPMVLHIAELALERRVCPVEDGNLVPIDDRLAAAMAL